MHASLDHFRAGAKNPRGSAWSIKKVRGISLSILGAFPQFVGVSEHSKLDLRPAGYATNFDVCIDFSQSNIAIGTPGARSAVVYIAFYAQVLGRQKYRAQFGLNPTTGAFVSKFPSGTSENGQCQQDGNAFAITARDTAALVWGLQMGVAGGAVGFNVTGIRLAGIAHGIERSP